MSSLSSVHPANTATANTVNALKSNFQMLLFFINN